MLATGDDLLRGDPGDRTATLVGLGLAVPALLALLLVVTRTDPDTWVPLVVALVLAAASLPVCLRLSRPPSPRSLRWVLVAALVLKLCAAGPRYLVNEVTYDGSADAGRYHDAGRTLYENVHDGRWSLEGAAIEDLPDETRSVGFVVGAVYLVIGTSQLGGYVVFAWISWIGLVLFLQAYRVAYPGAHPTRAAALVLLLPSSLYWPSSIGKDALMLFGLGLVTLGLARVVVGDRSARGLAALAAGCAVVAQIRPHLLLVVAAGVGVSLLVHTRREAADGAPRRRRWLALAGRGALGVALVVLLVTGLGRVDAMFGAPSGASGDASIGDALARTGERTSVGGSSFETQPVRSPLDLPVAAVEVLYRPFPFEARSVPAAVAALEGTLLLLATLFCARWLWRIGPAVARHPFAAGCAGFAVAFVVAFSNVGNAGILARQRVQVLPVLMLLVAAAAELRPARAPRPARTPLVTLPPAPVRSAPCSPA